MYAYIYTYIIYVVNSTIIIDVYRQRIIKKERPKEDEITIYGSCIGIPYVATVASTKTKHPHAAASVRMRYSRFNICLYKYIFIIQGTNEVRERVCFRSSGGCAK